jgi:integrase
MITVNDLCNTYFKSRFYTSLAPKTQRDYAYFLAKVAVTHVAGGWLGNMSCKKVSAIVAEGAYSQWVEHGPYYAEHLRSAARRVWSIAEKRDTLRYNPWKGIDPVALPPRHVKWTHEQLTTFFETAFAEPKWSNVGLIVLLAYTFGQRLGDMRVLTWENYCAVPRKLDLYQSKRGVGVSLPVDESMANTLNQQFIHWGDRSKYVCPHPVSLNAYTVEQLSKTANKIRNAAGLPSTLRVMDMRRTAVTEAADGGATMAEIMSMTGHQNVSSVKPYMGKSAKQAGAALSKRDSLIQHTYGDDT